MTPYVQEVYLNNAPPNCIRKYDTENINLDENININDYLRKNQNRKRSPLNYYKVKQNSNYFNYNKNFDNNNNYRNIIFKHFESDDFDEKNNNYKYREDEWKNKILKINKQKANYEYFSRDIDNYSNNTSYKKRNDNPFDDKSSSNTLSDFSNQILSQSMNINLNHPKSFSNYIYNNNYNRNIDLSNDYNQKYSQDFNSINLDLSDNSFKNQTYQNYYKINNNNFLNYNSNNESLSSNFYNESNEKNKTQNFTKKLKNKFSDISKLFNSFKSGSISSQDINSSSEYFRDDDSYYSVKFKRPMKNDERHYHQNLTIKIKKKEDNNANKSEKNLINDGQKKKPSYVDNTPEGCNLSTNTDYNKNINEKKISTFKLIPKEKKMNKCNTSINSDFNNYSGKNNNINNPTMLSVNRKTQNDLRINNSNLSNKNLFKNREPLMKSTHIKLKSINNNIYKPHKDILSNSRQFKRRSPMGYGNFNIKFNNIEIISIATLYSSMRISLIAILYSVIPISSANPSLYQTSIAELKKSLA